MRSSEIDNFTFIKMIVPDGHKIHVGKRYYVRPVLPTNVIKYRGQENIYFSPNSIHTRRKKTNVSHYNAFYGDLDFNDYDLAMSEAPAVEKILEEKDVEFILTCSGRGLHFYIPVDLDDGNEWLRLNLYINEVWFKSYTQVLDMGVAKDRVRILRLPQTVNKKNGKPCSVLYTRTGRAVDCRVHNYQKILEWYAKEAVTYSNPAPNSTRIENDDDRRNEYNFLLGRLKSKVFEKILNLDSELITTIANKIENRGLDSYLYPNLIAYCADDQALLARARKFVELCAGDVDKFDRWVTYSQQKLLKFNIKAVYTWAQTYFPGTKLERLATDDWNVFRYHSYYHYFLDNAETYQDVDSMRRVIGEWVRSKIGIPGIYPLVAECGVGKTEAFNRLASEGKTIVVLIPFTMSKIDIQNSCHPNLKVYTYDTIDLGVSSSPAFQARHFKLKEDLKNADIIVVDECHCLKTMQGISDGKKKTLQVVEDEILNFYSQIKPVFMLTATPAVSQIPLCPKPIVLDRRKKRLRVVIIDDNHLPEPFAGNDRVLVFIDNVRDVQLMEKKLTGMDIEHQILAVTGKTPLEERMAVVNSLADHDKYVVIASSAFSSGINVEFDTIVFTNKIVCQQNFYQVLGRLRAVNKLNKVHSIYVLNLSVFRNTIPDATEDQFEFFSPSVCIRYAQALFTITGIERKYDKKSKSIKRILTPQEIYQGILDTMDIKSFYNQYEHFDIPMAVIDQLAEQDEFDFKNWFGHDYIVIKDQRYKGNGDQFIKHKTRHCGQNVYVYVDLKVLEEIIRSKPNPVHYVSNFVNKWIRKHYSLQGETVTLKLASNVNNDK